jgi:hypothetical protein
METNCSDIISIAASILGFILAVYGLLTQPLIADSTRPSMGADQPPPDTASTVPARLWDDPFAVYPDKAEHKIPSLTEFKQEKSLILFLAVSTQHYVEDRETRLRLRFSVQRALIDQGYTQIEAHLLSVVEFSRSDSGSNTALVPNPPILATPAASLSGADSGAKISLPTTLPIANTLPAAHKRVSTIFRLPIQFFHLRPFAQEPAEVPNTEHYSVVTLVWLPDELMEVRSLQNVIASLKENDNLKPLFGKFNIIVLGPQNSDTLSTMLTSGLGEVASTDCTQDVKPLTIVSYGATISDPILATILRSAHIGPCPPPCLSSIFSSLLTNAGPMISYESKAARFIRLPGRDDALCREILNEIVKRGTLGIHSKSINIWLFTEWDTLYGRSLADTFKSISAPAEHEETTKDSVYNALNEVFSKNILSSQETFQNAHLRVNVIPYLQGLDGASTLYRKSYVDGAFNRTADTKAVDNPKEPHSLTTCGASQARCSAPMSRSFLKCRDPMRS